MVQTFLSLHEKDSSGHKKTIYAVTGAKTRDAALTEVAKHKKQNINMIKLTHSASVGVIYDDNLYWANSADRTILDNGTKCWAVRLKNDEVN